MEAISSHGTGHRASSRRGGRSPVLLLRPPHRPCAAETGVSSWGLRNDRGQNRPRGTRSFISRRTSWGRGTAWRSVRQKCWSADHLPVGKATPTATPCFPPPSGVIADVRDHASRSRVQGRKLRPDTRPLEAGRELYQETRAGDISSVCGDPVTRATLGHSLQSTDHGSCASHQGEEGLSGFWSCSRSRPRRHFGEACVPSSQTSAARTGGPGPEQRASPKGPAGKEGATSHRGPTLPLRKRGPALTCASQALRRCPGAARGLTASGLTGSS